MSDLLTEDQIAALVAAAREGQALPEAKPQASKRRAKRVREVDFTRPTRFTQDQQRRIARGHDAFCRAASTQLSAEFRAPIQLEVINTDQQTYSAGMAELPQPSLYAIVTTRAGLPILLSLEQSAVMTMIAWLLGGSTPSRLVPRDLTEIELMLTRRIFGMFVHQLSRTWEEILQTDLTLSGVESQQGNVQLASTSEPSLAITMELQIERLSATLSVLAPHRSLESYLEALNASQYGDLGDVQADKNTERLVSTALRGVDVEVRAEVGSRTLTVDDLLALQPGDVLKLGTSAPAGTLYAGAVPIHEVRPGRSGAKRAVEIVSSIGGSS
jgi:flagellar motor switch protein FliM